MSMSQDAGEADQLATMDRQDLMDYIQFLQDKDLELVEKINESNVRIAFLRASIQERNKIIQTLQSQLLQSEETCNVLANTKS